MACPTCDHTMQNLGVDSGVDKHKKIFWCPRCGTIKEVVKDHEQIEQTIWSRLIINEVKFQPLVECEEPLICKISTRFIAYLSYNSAGNNTGNKSNVKLMLGNIKLALEEVNKE